MIKKVSVISLIFVAMLLSGCGLLDEVNQGIGYSEEAMTYIEDVQQFTQEAPAMLEEAANDPETKAQLDEYVQQFLNEMESFQNIEPPGFAEDIHAQISSFSADAEASLQQLQGKLSDANMSVDELRNSELFQSLDQLRELQNTIENLGG
ncbi:hypothetical protein G4V62_17215 [Bacillaceae bacterium SIJ1]|uniref:DUF6376 family protein n=1 Tax=Litoribacterium kuwaitense TaxID=1398745 RepID=UPI0013E9FA58|nr:DUF6376 family protein [Litoribacterium kuwaitense]NGP46599.1 hypothetical protein [Litoribacterium kuwaitense]